MNIENKLESMGIQLSSQAVAGAVYVPVKQLGNALFVSGHIPVKAGKLIYTGKVGKEVTLEQAQEAARLCVTNILSSVKAYLGDLDKVKNIIKLQAFVSSEVGFDKQHIVVNAASQLLVDLWGEAGCHTRTAVGTNQLPMDAPVEIEAVIEV